MDRGASLRTGDVGSGPGGTKVARKKALVPQDGGGGPSTVVALGGNGSGSSHPTKPVDLDATAKKRYRLRQFKRMKERSNRRERDRDERLFTKSLKATATNKEPNRKERREHIQDFKPAKKTVKLSVSQPKTVIVDDGSNKFGSLRVESEVPSPISKTTTISTTTSFEEDVYWSPRKSTDKPVISSKVEDLDPKDERDSIICDVVLCGINYINEQEHRTTFVEALKTHFDAHKSGDDGLSKKEVNAALKSFAKKDRTGKFPKLEELKALFGDMDLNGAGRLSYDELTDFIDDIDADDIGAGRNRRGKGAGGIETIYLKEDRVPKLDYIYREDLQLIFSLKLERLKLLRLKLRYIIQQLAFRRQHKVTHLMAETFKHNLMFLNNIPNKDVVVSHGLLALPSTSDSKPLDGEATAAPGEASFEGQHAALAALGQAVLAALGVAFFQGSTPIDVVGCYVFSLDVFGDALSLDVLTNSNVLHKTGFMGAAPTVVFLGGSEGLNALLLDASAAAALDGVFKGRFGVAALHGQPVVVDAAPDDKQNAIDSLLEKHPDLFRKRILHNRTTRPYDSYVLSWEQKDASSEPKDQNETMEDVQPGEQTVLSTQLPFTAESLEALDCPPVPMREPTPEDKFIRFSFLLRETVKCEKGEESEAALIVPHEEGDDHGTEHGQTRVLIQLVKGDFTHMVKFASRASKEFTILGEDDYGFEFIRRKAPAMYRDMKCIFVLDPRAKGSSFRPRCAHAKGFVTLDSGSARGLECPNSKIEIHQHHITAHGRDCLLAPSTHFINTGFLASGIWGRQRPLHEQLNKLWEMIEHQHSIKDKTFVHLDEISAKTSGGAYDGNATLMDAFKPGGKLFKHLKEAEPTRVHELLSEGLPDGYEPGGKFYELKEDSEEYFPFWGRDTLLYDAPELKRVSVVYGICPITGEGGRKTKRHTHFPLVLHHITVGDKECFVGFINDNVNKGLGSTGAPNPFA